MENILYIYEGNGFTVISLSDGDIWQYYNNNLLVDNEIQFNHSRRIKSLNVLMETIMSYCIICPALEMINLMYCLVYGNRTMSCDIR